MNLYWLCQIEDRTKHWTDETRCVVLVQRVIFIFSPKIERRLIQFDVVRVLSIRIPRQIQNVKNMCTYHGILEEYPLISIDSFESHNYTSTMFFITHVHMDHLIGLERPEFGRYVAKINAPIYMSDISRSFLSTMAPYRHLIPYFKSVPLDQPFILTIQSNDPIQAKKKDGADIESLKTTLSSHTPNQSETIVVTCFGSGHCPGSIMIWIEGEHGNVLFTGDFRLYRGQAKRLTHLHRQRIDDDVDNDEKYLFKPIDNIYIDMTFFRPEILHIPTREVSCDALILWMKDLMIKEPKVKFYFKTSARVGYEQIYRVLYDRLGLRMHVEQGQYDFFACLPIIQECLTTDPSETCLHACRTSASNFIQPCSFFRNCEKPMRILLSIMWFTEQISANQLLVEYHEYHSNFEQKYSRRCLGVEDDRSNRETMIFDQSLSYRLCYSLHSSFAEIVDVLECLRPRRCTPIAAPLVSLLPTKRLFQLIEYFLQDKTNRILPSITLTQLNEISERKSFPHQIQMKHRYESFETRLERKRRRRFIQEQQQRRANDDELDLGQNDEREENIFRCLELLNRSKHNRRRIVTPISPNERILVEIDSEIEETMTTTFVLAMEIDPNERISFDDVRPIDNDSDGSSDTVDYQYDDQCESVQLKICQE